MKTEVMSSVPQEVAVNRESARVKRVVAAMVVVAFFLATTGIAEAQSAAAGANLSSSGADQNERDTTAAGLIDGELLAEGRRTGGQLGAGLGVGVLTGLIGTGIGYFVIGPDELSAEALRRAEGRSPDYQLGLRTGYERKTKSKKRNAFLAGGLLGTAAWVALFVAANSE
jgi:hypothetical protein